LNFASGSADKSRAESTGTKPEPRPEHLPRSVNGHPSDLRPMFRVIAMKSRRSIESAGCV
jgi:hypothetical protein